MRQAEETFETFKKLGNVLGLFERLRRSPVLSEEEAELIKRREQARKEKNFKLADSIRDGFAERGIRLMDTPRGTRWRIE